MNEKIKNKIRYLADFDIEKQKYKHLVIWTNGDKRIIAINFLSLKKHILAIQDRNYIAHPLYNSVIEKIKNSGFKVEDGLVIPLSALLISEYLEFE